MKGKLERLRVPQRGYDNQPLATGPVISRLAECDDVSPILVTNYVRICLDEAGRQDACPTLQRVRVGE